MAARSVTRAESGGGIFAGVLRWFGVGGRWRVSDDVSMVSHYLLLLTLLGAAFVVAEEWGGKPYTALLWSIACFAVGALIGFLFGIPRVLQTDGPAPLAPAGSGGAAAGAAGAAPDDSSYSLRVNTNLEQISDWLTKIFVGLGLVELQRVPEHLNRAANFVAQGLGASSKFFAGALIVYFTVLGFLGFYLITRLYIAGALSRADQEARQRLEDRLQVEGIEVRTDPRRAPLAGEQRAAALSVVRQPVSETDAPEDLAVRAKAQLSLGNYEAAVTLYRGLVASEPDDTRLRFEYGVALFYQEAREDAYRQLQEAYRLITPATDRVLKKNIYRSLTYQALYRPAPGGFEDAITYGEEYVRDGRNIPDPGIWTNLASAYGQRAAWWESNPPADPELVRTNRLLALGAVTSAAGFGDRWKNRLRELMQRDYPNKDPSDTDLEPFEREPDFRAAVGLPPLA